MSTSATMIPLMLLAGMTHEQTRLRVWGCGPWRKDVASDELTLEKFNNCIAFLFYDTLATRPVRAPRRSCMIVMKMMLTASITAVERPLVPHPSSVIDAASI